jgi:hypothetical protein
LPMLQNWYLTTTMLRHAMLRLRYKRPSNLLDLNFAGEFTMRQLLNYMKRFFRTIKETSSAK